MATNTLQQNIPKGWQRVRLGDISRLRKGLTYKSTHYSDKQNGMIFLTLKSIQRGGGFNTDGIKYYSGDFDKSAIVKEDDLVIANTDITRDAAVVGAPMLLPKLQTAPALISMDLSVLDVERERANNHYIYYLLQTPKARNFMRDHSSGSTVLHLKTKDVPTLDISLPPLPEQKRIAEILGAVDEEIQKTDEIIAATERLKRGLMQKLFSLKNETRSLSQIAELITKGTTPTTYGHSFTEKGINFFKIENIDESGNIDLTSCKHVSQITNEFLKRSQLKVGDILFSIAGALGRIAVINESHLPANTNQAIAIIRLKDTSDAMYVSQALSTNNTRKQVIGHSVQLAQANISLGKLGAVKIPWPSFGERQNKSRIIQSINEKISINQKLKEKLTLLKKGLMQDLLTGKKRTI